MGGRGFVFYEYTPSPPTPVQTGDIVGIIMPVDESDRALSVRPLFLRLPEGNSSTISCVPPSSNLQQIILVNGMCINEDNRQSEYIPLIFPIFSELPNYTML